ncbi:MAG: apolipoprotein N-acyltransferase [Bacteroidota bacterium]|nr:apolipoprotein N-acyltransferase [Bacteroidota bacterium]
MNLSGWRAFALSALGGIIMSIAFTQWHMGWIALIGLLPFLLIEDYIFKNRGKYRSVSFYLRILPGFLIWNIISIFWIWFSTAPGAVFAVLWNANVMCLAFLLYHKVRLRFNNKEAYTALVVFWLAFEFIYLRVTLSFPWLLLGNAFANNVRFIQWYEFTGVPGGTLWILIVNLLFFEMLRTYRDAKAWTAKLRNYVIVTSAFLIVPILISVIQFANYEEQGETYDIVVLQPNIDPYKKFKSSTTEQLHQMLALSDRVMDDSVDYLVFPETALPLYLDADSAEFEWHPIIHELRNYSNKYPNLKLVVGLTSRDFYYTEAERSETSHAYQDFWFDEYNVTYQLDTTRQQQKYYKSKLVPGVETLPLVENWTWLNDMIINLGGARNSLTGQEYRTVLVNPQDSIAVGTPICYESIYGEFLTEFVRNGANFLFVVTNDGWWKDTPGYKQHAMFSRIRAIENRRSIARSANTGISSLINQKGEVLASRGWWVEAVIRGEIHANEKLTFYSRYGDYIGRISLFVAVLILLHLISYRLMNRRLRKE